MQIHELNSFSGTPSAADFLAIDNGDETLKVPATLLGVSTEMTEAEAEAGTVTDPRVISPAVFKAASENIAEEAAEAAAEKRDVLVINISSFSSLPKTITNAAITADLTVTEAVLGTPSAQTSEWEVTTANGSLTITGSINGSTTLTLKMQPAKEINV